MHEGCTGKYENGLQVIQKLRMMGYNSQTMPMPAVFDCKDCNETITMTTFEFKCPHCEMVYGVTPCHASDVNSIMAAGKQL